MDDLLKQILAELQVLKTGQDSLQAGQDALRTELKEFKESQEVTNKLLIGDTAGIKNQLRDMRDEMKEFRDWTRTTQPKIDSLEDKLGGMRNALNRK